MPIRLTPKIFHKNCIIYWKCWFFKTHTSNIYWYQIIYKNYGLRKFLCNIRIGMDWIIKECFDPLCDFVNRGLSCGPCSCCLECVIIEQGRRIFFPILDVKAGGYGNRHLRSFIFNKINNTIFFEILVRHDPDFYGFGSHGFLSILKMDWTCPAKYLAFCFAMPRYPVLREYLSSFFLTNL